MIQWLIGIKDDGVLPDALATLAVVGRRPMLSSGSFFSYLCGSAFPAYLQRGDNGWLLPAEARTMFTDEGVRGYDDVVTWLCHRLCKIAVKYPFEFSRFLMAADRIRAYRYVRSNVGGGYGAGHGNVYQQWKVAVSVMMARFVERDRGSLAGQMWWKESLDNTKLDEPNSNSTWSGVSEAWTRLLGWHQPNPNVKRHLTDGFSRSFNFAQESEVQP